MSQITQKLRAIMALDPDRAEIDFDGQEYSWGDIARVVHAVEAGLDAMALPAETRVGVMLRNRPGHVAAMLAVLATDRCLVTLNPALPDTRLVADIAGLNLAAIIADADDLVRDGIAAQLANEGMGVIAIGSALDLVAVQSLPTADLSPTTAPGVAIEMLTSGTTGTPKRVPLARSAFDASFAAFTRYERGREFVDKPQLRSGVTIVVNPLTHIGGIYGCIGALIAGRKIALLERFTVDSWVAAIKRNEARVAPAVPSALKMILEADVPREDLSSLTALISGTAPLDPDTVDAFYARFGIPVLANYGATEFAGAVAGWTIDDFRAHWSTKRGSAGRIHADMVARIVDPDTGAVLELGEQGVLELKGAQLNNALQWLRTTDRAVLDEDNFLFIRGRADNAIVRGGFKVHPDEVVAALHQHPCIREAAVVGVADARLGEVPAAAIILKDGSSPPAQEELKTFLKGRLIAYQVPVHFRYVTDFPRTPSMKPSTPGLKALFKTSS
ncbi:class I adenylate-forming enzyme family protein [Blastomonas sp.]|uniref:class I adenylate-forming enzyme family protein n=1 Tax=Blastomonas sp. TaxID=1909299 RepID=UPI0026226C42|nr:long-chain fatty acid--CoA ligase [Blastomonas sp.]MDM7957643.1 AMP-binding protein [Blastomonas sp.]